MAHHISGPPQAMSEKYACWGNNKSAKPLGRNDFGESDPIEYVFHWYNSDTRREWAERKTKFVLKMKAHSVRTITFILIYTSI